MSPQRAGRVAWFHCFSGIAGDMTLGALIDAGADIDEVRDLCGQLPVDGWELEAEAVLRGGIAATNVTVVTEDTTVHRTAAHIIGLVEEARLPERVTRRAVAAFTALAEVEGALHRRPPSQVHFHEVGGLDAIVDVVGSCVALELLGIDRVACSPIATGTGMVRSAHGAIPNPAPATVALLRGAPTYGLASSIELTTPTGAALISTLATAWGPMPPMRIDASGFGAGDAKTDDRPNLLQVVLGEVEAKQEAGQPVTLLETNVDDITGEQLATAIAALLDAGAHDAWITPIIMKKGRPAYQLSALADPSLAGQIAAEMQASTGTFGIRGREIDRWPIERRMDTVDVHGRAVRVKVSAGRAKVEHDDAARAAEQLGLPIREVISLAEEALRRRHPDPDDAPSLAPRFSNPFHDSDDRPDDPHDDPDDLA